MVVGHVHRDPAAEEREERINDVLRGWGNLDSDPPADVEHARDNAVAELRADLHEVLSAAARLSELLGMWEFYRSLNVDDTIAREGLTLLKVETDLSIRDCRRDLGELLKDQTVRAKYLLLKKLAQHEDSDPVVRVP
jgi:hypothetical protein